MLDAGCATGDFLAAGSGSYEIWGLDVSAAATEQARAANPGLAAQISTGFSEDQHFDHAFDAIVIWDLLEQLWDPRGVLTRLVEHLRPRAALVLSTPDIGAPVARLMGSRWAFMTPPEHLGFFNRETLRFLLEQVLGLQTICTEASGKWQIWVFWRTSCAGCCRSYRWASWSVSETARWERPRCMSRRRTFATWRRASAAPR